MAQFCAQPAAQQGELANSGLYPALAHKVSDEVVAAYWRTTFFDLRKRMMEARADYCARPSGSDDTVVAFGRNREAGETGLATQ